MAAEPESASPGVPRAAAAAILLVAAAGLLWVLRALGLTPMAELARAASADGQLDAPYVALLRDAQGLLIPCLLLGAALAFTSARWMPLARRLVEGCPGRAFGSLLFLLTAGPGWWVQQHWFGGIPHITDAVSHVFQAHIFAAGQVTAPAPDCPPAFFADNILIRPSGVWHTKYFPGTALWLAFWLRIGLLSWALPVAWGIAVVCVARTVTIAYSTLTGRLTGLLLASSPMGILLAGSYMSHTVAVAWLAVAAWAAAEGLQASRRSWFLLAGAAAGAALITRPQDVPPAGLLFLLCIILAGSQRRRALLTALPIGMIGASLPIAVLLTWNRLVFGGWLSSGYNFGTTISVTPVIRDAIGFTDWYTPRDAVHHLFWTLLRLNKALLGWPSSLLLLPLAFCVRRLDARDGSALAAAAAVVGVYFCFPYYGFEYEARYHLAATPLLVLLVVRGLRRLAGAGPAGGALAVGLLGASLLHAAVYYWPRYLAPAYSRAYEHVSGEYDAVSRAEGLDHALVLVPSHEKARLSYAAAFLFNDPWLERSVIYARDLPEQLDCLRAAFPDRRVYRFDERTRRVEPLVSPPTGI